MCRWSSPLWRANGRRGHTADPSPTTARSTIMATPTIHSTEQPLTVECDESQERRILPVLAEWRAQVVGAPAHPRPLHAGAERADQIPREYATMPADELDLRI